jgi:hypothetical protein
MPVSILRVERNLTIMPSQFWTVLVWNQAAADIVSEQAAAEPIEETNTGVSLSFYSTLACLTSCFSQWPEYQIWEYGASEIVAEQASE